MIGELQLLFKPVFRSLGERGSLGEDHSCVRLQALQLSHVVVGSIVEDSEVQVGNPGPLGNLVKIRRCTKMRNFVKCKSHDK